MGLGVRSGVDAPEAYSFVLVRGGMRDVLRAETLDSVHCVIECLPVMS